jgi:hypothetical protein
MSAPMKVDTTKASHTPIGIVDKKFNIDHAASGTLSAASMSASEALVALLELTMSMAFANMYRKLHGSFNLPRE